MITNDEVIVLCLVQFYYHLEVCMDLHMHLTFSHNTTHIDLM